MSTRMSASAFGSVVSGSAESTVTFELLKKTLTVVRTVLRGALPSSSPLGLKVEATRTTFVEEGYLLVNLAGAADR